MYTTVNPGLTDRESIDNLRDIVDPSRTHIFSSSVVQDRLEKYIRDAQNLVDGYLMAYVTVPIPDIDVPDVIEFTTAVLALYLLWAKDHTDENNKYYGQYRERISYLKSIQDGKIHFPLKGATELHKPVTCSKSVADRSFTDETMETW